MKALSVSKQAKLSSRATLCPPTRDGRASSTTKALSVSKQAKLSSRATTCPPSRGGRVSSKTKAFSVSKQAKLSSRATLCPPTRDGRSSPTNIAVSIVLAVLLTGCAGGGKSPETTTYLLRSTAPTSAGESVSSNEVGLGRIRVAGYLSQPGIIVELEPGQIRSARFHEWAEPLSAGLRFVLRADIARSLGADIDVDPTRRRVWRLAVDIDVEEFHGTLAGSARLNASWTLTNRTGDVVAAHRFSDTEALSRSGYDGLVDAQVALAARLGAAIAESIRDADSD